MGLIGETPVKPDKSNIGEVSLSTKEERLLPYDDRFECFLNIAKLDGNKGPVDFIHILPRGDFKVSHFHDIINKMMETIRQKEIHIVVTDLSQVPGVNGLSELAKLPVAVTPRAREVTREATVFVFLPKSGDPNYVQNVLATITELVHGVIDKFIPVRSKEEIYSIVTADREGTTDTES